MVRQIEMLEHQFQSKLHRSRIAYGGDRAKVSQRYVACDRSEVRVIENVERLGTNLSREPFGESQVLHHRNVDAIRRRSFKHASRRRSRRGVYPDSGVRGIQREALVRDPHKTVRRIRIRIAKQIWTSGGVGVNQTKPGRIKILSRDSERQASVDDDNSRGFPAA